ncbi:unnamed protein product [Sphagnum troendelagicum]|uniref:Uncharacterized protein n=1 Tax=Sphagnum troendelagicum TaxID=128251 RepID=A0ABP0V062_9BRYO
MSLNEGRKEELGVGEFCVKKSRPRAHARGRNAPISSLHETGQQKLTIITRCGTGLVGPNQGGLFLDSQPIVGPNQGGLFLDALVGPDQTEGRLFLATVGGTRPKWAFLGRLCGTGPNQSQREEGGLFLGALVEPDQIRQNQSRRGKRKVGFSSTPLWNQTTPDRTRPDQTKSKLGGLY